MGIAILGQEFAGSFLCGTRSRHYPGPAWHLPVELQYQRSTDAAYGDTRTIANTDNSTTPARTPDPDKIRQIIELKAQIRQVDRQLEEAARLFQFTGEMTRKLICLGQVSDDEMISAVRLGIQVKIDEDCPWNSLRLPVWKRDKFTEMDEWFLRLNGELPDESDFGAQFPEMSDPIVTEPEDSTIVLHKAHILLSEISTHSFVEHDEIVQDRLEHQQCELLDEPIASDHASDSDIENDGSMTSDSLFDCESPGHDHDYDDTLLLEGQSYVDRLNRIDQINQETNQQLSVILESARDMTKMASSIARRIQTRSNLACAKALDSFTKTSTVAKQSSIATIIANPDCMWQPSPSPAVEFLASESDSLNDDKISTKTTGQAGQVKNGQVVESVMTTGTPKSPAPAAAPGNKSTFTSYLARSRRSRPKSSAAPATPTSPTLG